MARQFIKINPVLDENGEFMALKSYTNEGIKPNPFDGADTARTMEVTEHSKILTTSSKIEVAAIGGVENSFGVKTFVKDFAIYRLSRANSGNKIITGTYWGYGIRIKIKVRNIQFGVQVSYGMVAAAAQLGLLNADFEIEGIGICNSALFDLLPAPMDMNMDNFNKMLELGHSLTKFYASADPEGVIYKPFAIEVDEKLLAKNDVLRDDKHVIFCYKQLAKGFPLRRALDNADDHKLDAELVKRFYKEIANLENLTDRPSFKQIDNAKQWLRI